MQERVEFIQTPAGRMETFIAHPDGSGPFAGVVMYQNVGGHSEFMRAMGRRVAAEGYYCAVPDLYYRIGKVVIDPDSRDEHILAVRAALSASMRDSSRAMEDTRAVLALMDADPLVHKGPKGCIGYCGGGRLAPIAAGTFPDVIKATSSQFGTRLIGDAPDSPHLLIPKFSGELYFGFAEHDHHVPLETVEKWRGLMRERCSVPWSIDIHPGAEHGYAFPGRAVYQEAAAELSWSRTFEMFRRQLPQSRKIQAGEAP